jgi:hypothetical protein
MKCTICLKSETDQQELEAIKIQLNKNSGDLELNSDKLVHELGESNTRVLSYRFNVIEFVSVVETKSFQKKDEVKQRPIDESNFLVNMCAQYLKLAERADGENEKVILDIQYSKISSETYENDSKWSCSINNIRLTCTNSSKSIEQVSCDTVF